MKLDCTIRANGWRSWSEFTKAVLNQCNINMVFPLQDRPQGAGTRGWSRKFDGVSKPRLLWDAVLTLTVSPMNLESKVPSPS
jgi:hypothetical protein